MLLSHVSRIFSGFTQNMTREWDKRFRLDTSMDLQCISSFHNKELEKITKNTSPFFNTPDNVSKSSLLVPNMNVKQTKYHCNAKSGFACKLTSSLTTAQIMVGGISGSSDFSRWHHAACWKKKPSTTYPRLSRQQEVQQYCWTQAT